MTLVPILAPDQRYDWWRIISDLLRDGVSIQAICESTGIPKSTLLGYRNLDAEPKHADGQRLAGLWALRNDEDPPIRCGSVRIDRRTQAEEMALQQRCTSCGQTIRGALLDKWLQLRIHYDEHGGPAPT